MHEISKHELVQVVHRVQWAALPDFRVYVFNDISELKMSNDTIGVFESKNLQPYLTGRE